MEVVKIKRLGNWQWWVVGVLISLLILGFSVIYYWMGREGQEPIVPEEAGRGSGFAGFGEEESLSFCGEMSETLAREIAQKSECSSEGNLGEVSFCNENSKTWWIEMEAERPGCSPACVVWTETGEAEINWRCTGLSN